jgi:DNA polymerase
MKDPRKYEEIYHKRLELKAKGDPLQAVLKLVLNSTYGVMKDPSNGLYDPRQANRVCVYGQLLILDLIEKLEPYCQLIQSNTDGILIKMQKPDDYYLIDEICAEWEERTGLNLEFDEYCKVFQKDVNNYVVVPHGDLYNDKGKPRWKSKGAYVKKLNPLDYDLPIINQALIDFMVKGIPVEQTILGCKDLKEFQLVSKISGKYDCILHGDAVVNEKCIRIFASKNEGDAGVTKVHATTKKAAKIQNSPEHCFIYNDEVNGVQCPVKLDKQWYINLALKRLKDFGVIA